MDLALERERTIAEFEVHLERYGDVVHMRLAGELDIAVIDELQERVAEVGRSATRVVVLDLRELTFIDSSGVRALLGAQAQSESSFELVVVRPRGQAGEVLDLVRADTLLTLVNDTAPYLPPDAGERP